MGAAKTESATTASKARFISFLHGQNQRSGLRLLILHVGSSRCLEKHRGVLIKIVHSMRVTCRPAPRPSFGLPHSHPCASWSGSKRLFARLVSPITGAGRASRNSAGPRQLTISSATCETRPCPGAMRGDPIKIHTRFSRWAETGVWKKVFEILAADADNEYAMIDSTIVRAHQHSAGAQKKTTKTRRSGAARAD